MTIELEDETADNITLETLITSYDNLFDTLEKTLSDEDFTAVYSFDFDEEVFAIIKELKALDLIINNFGGKVKNSVEDLLKQKNEELYLTDKSMEELKKENEFLKNKNNCIEEELNALKDKIKKLIG